MAGYLGLFDPVQGDPRQAAINARRQQEIALGQASPDQQIGAARMMAAGNAGAGASQLGRGLFGAATGADIRSPEAKLEAVKAKVAAALQGQDMTDPDKVYPVLIRALQEAGLVPQAMQAVKEFEEITNKRRDDKRAETKDAELATDRRVRREILQEGSATMRAVQMLGRLIDQRNKLPPGDPERDALDVQIRTLQQNLAKDNIQVQDAGDRLQVFVNGEPTSTVKKGVDPTKLATATAKGKGGQASVQEGAAKIGLTDNGAVVVKGSKTGRLYVYDSEGGMIPYSADVHGAWKPTQTEAEARTQSLGGRMTASNVSLDSATPEAIPNSMRTKLYFSLDASPVRQAALYSTFSDAEKNYLTAVRQFLNANLRYDSGAAVPESEYPKYMDALIPYSGEGVAQREQKAKNRRDSARLIVREGVTGSAQRAAPAAPAAAPAAPAAGGAVAVTRGADGKLIIQRGR